VSDQLRIRPLCNMAPTLTAWPQLIPAWAATPTGCSPALADDEGLASPAVATPRCKRLGGGQPATAPRVLSALRGDGWSASASALMPAQVRTDAPWPVCWACERRLNRLVRSRHSHRPQKIFGIAAIFWVLIRRLGRAAPCCSKLQKTEPAGTLSARVSLGAALAQPLRPWFMQVLVVGRHGNAGRQIARRALDQGIQGAALVRSTAPKAFDFCR